MDWMVSREKRDYLVSLDPEAEREYLGHLAQWDRREILVGMATLGCLVKQDRKESQVLLEKKELLGWMDQEDSQG